MTAFKKFAPTLAGLAAVCIVPMAMMAPQQAEAGPLARLVSKAIGETTYMEPDRDVVVHCFYNEVIKMNAHALGVSYSEAQFYLDQSGGKSLAAMTVDQLIDGEVTPSQVNKDAFKSGFVREYINSSGGIVPHANDVERVASCYFN